MSFDARVCVRPVADIPRVRQREQTMTSLRALSVLAIWLWAATASAEPAGLGGIESRYTYLNDWGPWKRGRTGFGIAARVTGQYRSG